MDPPWPTSVCYSPIWDHDEFVYEVEQLETVETRNFMETPCYSEKENTVPVAKESIY